MDFRASRLRRGEVIAAVSGVLLLAFMFLLTWYGLKTPVGWTAATLGLPTSFSGWHELTHLHWLLLITPASAIALAYFQATRRAPAVAVSLAVILLVLAALTVLLLAYRVLISVPGTGDLHPKAGAYLGLLSAVGILYGAYQSIRREGVHARDAPTQIETVKLGTATRP
jgi:hypothetical protein